MATMCSIMTSPPFGTYDKKSFFGEFGSAHASSAKDYEPQEQFPVR